MIKTNAAVAAQIKKGWKPNRYLTNMSVAYFQDPAAFVARKLFPVVPVVQSTSKYYEFSRADLARDNVQRKPKYGKVQPGIFGISESLYNCNVDQIIIGLDKIDETDYMRDNTPGMIDPRRAKIRLASEQMAIHMDLSFANAFFKAGAWTNQLTGVTTTPSGSQFYKFNDSNFDPVAFFRKQITEMQRKTRKKPNKLALGAEAFDALVIHPDIIERVKYSGSTANPAIVTPNVLAQLLGVDEVLVMESTYNDGGIGTEDMKYVCDPKGALLCYSNNAPAIDEASAGYIFAWDMLGNGNWLAFDQFEPNDGTHTEYVEGLVSYDMKKVCDDLGLYLTACV